MTMRISLDGFKGQFTDQDLKKITVFLGPNGSGKSARLEALRFVLSGETGEAKTNQDLFRLYRPTGKDEVSVALDRDGETFTRTLTVDKKGTVKQEVRIGDGKPQSGTSGKTLFSEKFMSPEDFDLGAFFNMSNERKKSLLLSLLGTEKSADVFRSVVREKLQNSDVRAAFDRSHTESIETMLADMVEYAQGILNGLYDERRRYEKTTITGSEVKTENTAATVDLETLRAEQNRLNAEYLETAKELAAVRGMSRATAKHTEDLKKTESRIKLLQEIAARKVTDQDDHAAVIAALETAINEAKGRLQFLNLIAAAFAEGRCPFNPVGCGIDLVEKMNEYQAEEATLAETIGNNKAEIETHRHLKRRQEIETAEIKNAKEELDRARQQYKELEKSMNEIKSGGDPDALGVQADGLKASMDEIEKKIDSAILSREANLMIKKAAARMAALEPEIESIKSDVETLKDERIRMIRESISGVETEINAILSKIDPAFAFQFFNKKGDFELSGINSSGVRVSIGTMSGGEKAAYYSALLLALVNVKKCGCRILLADTSELDGPSLGRFVQALQANRDRFDLALVASWYADAEITTDAETLIVPLKRKESLREGTAKDGDQAELFGGAA